MTITEILKELETCTGSFPRAAMEAAIAQREEITPELLRVIEAVAADPAVYAARNDYMLPLFALHLLAQFRETRAYEPIVKMVGGPDEAVDDLLGETITDGLNRIFASVYNGNPVPLQSLVENEAVNEFVRGSALEAMVGLVRINQLTRDEVAGYFRSLFHGKLPRDYSFAWNSLVDSVAQLPAPELLEDVRQAFADNLVDTSVASLADLERDLSSGLPKPGVEFTLITDAIAEMDWWMAFKPCEPADGGVFTPSLPPVGSEPPWVAPEPHEPPQPVRREPKIGRNEPCPCGSGKKYKKCCGQ
jgi:hypothetical protein